MDFGVLGSLYVEIDGMTATPGGPKLRQILSLLLLNLGTPVPASALMRELWSDEPPSSSVATLHTHVMHLRRFLATASGVSAEYIARNILTTRSGSYLLRDDAGRLDLNEFRHLTATARDALRLGYPVTVPLEATAFVHAHPDGDAASVAERMVLLLDVDKLLQPQDAQMLEAALPAVADVQAVA